MIENFTTLFKHKNTYCNNKMSWLVEVVIGCFQALREHNYYFEIEKIAISFTLLRIIYDIHIIHFSVKHVQKLKWNWIAH